MNHPAHALLATLALLTLCGPGCSDDDDPGADPGVTADAGADSPNNGADTDADEPELGEDGFPVDTPAWGVAWEEVWYEEGETCIFSSARAVDLDGDGVQELIQGHGKENLRAGAFDGSFEPFGYMTVRDSSTGAQLGRVDARDELVGSPTLIDLTGDGVEDFVIGGRNAELMAVSGSDYSLLWRFYPDGGAREDGWYNFYTPQAVGDLNEDGVPDLLAANGGDATKPPGDPDRPPGHLMLISGADGAVIASSVVPGGGETYMSPIVYRPTPEAPLHALFGTGGETLPGSLWRVAVSDLADGDLSAAEELIAPTDAGKGLIAPPSLGDLNGDGALDIVVPVFDGRLVALDGESGQVLWSHSYPGQESIATPALGHFDDNPGLDVAALFLSGTFPTYRGSVHLIVRGDTGEVVFEEELPEIRGAVSPLAVDLTGDGRDEVLWGVVSGRGQLMIAVLDLANQPRLRRAWVTTGFTVSTPIVGDFDGDGALELIVSTNLPRTEYTWGMTRLDLKASTPARISWGAYLGTNADGSYALDD